MSRTDRQRPRRLASRALAIAAVGVLACAAAPAAMAGDLAQGRALLLTQRFTPGSTPRGSDLARNLVAQPGERVYLQAVVKPPAGVATLAARVESDAPEVAGAELMRVGFVTVVRPTTGLGARPGTYADPLPPLPAGGFAVQAGKNAGVVVAITVPADAEPGVRTGRVVFSDARGDWGELPFTLRVASVAAMPFTDPAAFSVVLPVSLASLDAFMPITTGKQRLTQMTNLVRMLHTRHVTPEAYPFGDPTLTPGEGGLYPTIEQTNGAWWRSPGSFLGAYVGDDAAADAAAARSLPSRAREKKVEQMAAAERARFLKAVGSAWRSRGFDGADNLIYHVWDEPGQKVEQNVIGPLTAAVHAALPGVKTYVNATPQVVRPARRLCKWFGNRACLTIRGTSYSNEHLWDGGADDPDIWSVPLQRFYGRWTSTIEAHYGIDHGYDTYKLLQTMKKRGKTIWTYSYSNWSKQMPEMAVDAPGTDVLLLFAWNAYEGTAGYYHWGFNRWLGARGGSTTPRNPYTDTISWTAPGTGSSNGEANLVYPSRNAAYGLSSSTAAPVSSLRFEAYADGAELVNLVAQARAIKGNAWVRRQFRPIFGTGKVIVAAHGMTWPAYRNGGLARRLEVLRQKLILAVEAG